MIRHSKLSSEHHTNHSESTENATSTPKRRRLGITRKSKSGLGIYQKTVSPVRIRRISQQGCESPLPCNQIEYLHSSNNTSTDSVIPESPEIAGCIGGLTSKLFERTFISNTCNSQRSSKQGDSTNTETKHDDEEINDDMFKSQMNIQQSSFVAMENNLKLESYRQQIDDSFNAVNKSIVALENETILNVDNLFETRDSFLLDIKDTLTDGEKNVVKETTDSFYGLPLLTKNLFKNLRNIDKFYDWQEECLNLDAVKQRRNLIYSLPTCGGKTLVAEVLMLREVLVRKKHALFILPFVAIAQEKIYGLSPFAVQLNFLVEEYAAGKGHIPPKKRRTKNSIYIATIEKGLALVRSLIELDRLDEIGLVVVDELHLLGEAGRGATLETLLTTVKFANESIQIVGMSATIGNLSEVAQFLDAEVYEGNFRPVELQEYVKLDNELYRIIWKGTEIELVKERDLKYDYTAAALALDPDCIGGLVSEVVPHGSCLVFCPTKRNCENVANLLCKIQRNEMSNHRREEREALSSSLREAGAPVALCGAVSRGVAYHHAGLAADERAEVEAAFRAGTVSVLCCTSTLATGVNLPAGRVVVRAPAAAPAPLAAAGYRQIAGRAGRVPGAGPGECIIISNRREWCGVAARLSGGVAAARSSLALSAGDLALSALALRLARRRPHLRALLAGTLLAVQHHSLGVDIKQLCDDAIRSLIKCGAIDTGQTSSATAPTTTPTAPTTAPTAPGDDSARDIIVVDDKCYVHNDTTLKVSDFGKAAINGCMDLVSARRLLEDLQRASKALVLQGSCHLLYLLTPHDGITFRIDYRLYYSLYCALGEECAHTAQVLGITEKVAIRMMTGKPITSVSETVLRRFYLALALHDLWNQVPFTEVANKYNLERGAVQSLMTSASSSAAAAARFCECVRALWPFRALFTELAPRLQHCASPDIQQLMELPGVKRGRAVQLVRAGLGSVRLVAAATLTQLGRALRPAPSRPHLLALQAAAKMMLIEKVENLRAEADEVMDGLQL